MDESLLSSPLLPVASEEDAVATIDAALPYLSNAERVIVVYVVEKAGGAPDKASVEQREEIAAEAFAAVRKRAADADVAVETEVLYGTDVAETILDAARDADASAVVFRPRESKSWWNLFGHDVRDALVTECDRPVVVLPSGDR